jgi:hypothetical protein
MRKRRNRIYWRERGGRPRAYGDFRDFTSALSAGEARRLLGSRALPRMR